MERRHYDDLGQGMKIGISWTGGDKGSREEDCPPLLNSNFLHLIPNFRLLVS